MHTRLAILRVAADGVMVQSMSAGLKPVPENDTGVPVADVPVMGGEPWFGLIDVICGVTVKVAVREVSP